MSVNSVSVGTAGVSTNASVAILVGRVLISILFILAGFGKLTALSGTAAWFGSIGLPVPEVTAVVVGLVELLGGLAILVGFQTRVAAIVIALFTLGATAIAHLDFADANNILALQKNLSITGGLILLAVLGAGALSVDGRRS